MTTRLRELRISKGLTIKALANELNIKESTLSKYERAEREPNIETLILISNYFHVSVDYLIGKTDCIFVKYQPISDLLGVDGKTIEILQELTISTTKYNRLDYLEAMIQHPHFPLLLQYIMAYADNDTRGWEDIKVADTHGKNLHIVPAEIMKTSSMQLIQNTFKGIIDSIPYSKHFLDKK